MVVEMQKAVRQAEIEFQDSMLRIVSKLVRVQPTANDAQIRIQLVQLLGLTYDHVTVEAALLAARAQQDEDEESRVSLLIQEAYDKQMAEENRTSDRRKRRQLRQATSPPGDTPSGDTAEAAAATALVTAAAPVTAAVGVHIPEMPVVLLTESEQCIAYIKVVIDNPLASPMTKMRAITRATANFNDCLMNLAQRCERIVVGPMAPAHDAALLASASADWHAEHQNLHAAGAPGDARGSQSSAGGETLEAAVYGAAPAHVVAGQALHADGSPGDAGVKALVAGGELVAPHLAAVDLDVDAAFVPDPLASYNEPLLLRSFTERRVSLQQMCYCIYI